jgi:hypothetical protein
MFASADVYANTTPLHSPVHRWEEIKPGVAKPTHSFSFEKLTGGSSAARSLEVFRDVSEATHLSGSSSAHATANTVAPSGQAAQHSVPSVGGEAEVIASQRVRLLAAKYVGGKPSREVLARLAILDEKLLAALPRVTHDQVFALEQIAERLIGLSTSREQRAKKFDIPA